MLCRGESTGVFQVESRAQMSMLPRLKPRCYYDLVIEVAIIRPGPIQGGMVHPYLRRRQGLDRKARLYPSPDLERVLSRTLRRAAVSGQLMQIAMVATGFSAGEADPGAPLDGRLAAPAAAWISSRTSCPSGMLARGYTPEFAETHIPSRCWASAAMAFPKAIRRQLCASSSMSPPGSGGQRVTAFAAGLLNSMPMGFYAAAQLVADARRNGVSFRRIRTCNTAIGTAPWNPARTKAAGSRAGIPHDRRPGRSAQAQAIVVKPHGRTGRSPRSMTSAHRAEPEQAQPGPAGESQGAAIAVRASPAGSLERPRRRKAARHAGWTIGAEMTVIESAVTQPKGRTSWRTTAAWG